ncbi:HPr kinase/phosphatase C-terminal domain-containing protein [Erythrobacter sp. JK5]|nr:HPr kinase/phosphatase C-terminal domain-containing protein [Erythrobacter sp. JK5]
MQASAVAISGRALLLEGPPGSGKSSLALALIDRGARLIGDDGVILTRQGERLIATPPPNTTGLIEIRNVGLIELPVAPPAPLALILSLAADAERLPDSAQERVFLGLGVPALAFTPGAIAPAVRAEWALHRHGLAPD